jgi:predicted DNA-binding transcriptional regulator YafY
VVPRGPNAGRLPDVQGVADRDARLLDRPAERPDDFDLAAYWKASTEELRKRPRYEATLRVEPRTAESLRTWRNTEPVDGAEPDHTGWVTLRVEFEDEEQARFFALGLSPRVDVLGPAPLRQQVAGDLAAALERARRTS